jgi:ornithine cyclodeaminase/alanine dehydrogenase-like protein (mu-crystallin family)
MKTLIVSQHQVPQLLPMRECIDVMEGAFAALARGQATIPLRPIMWLPDKSGMLILMPSHLGDLNAMGVKVLGVFPGNEGTEFDAHQGAVMLFETKHGQILAIVDATSITAIRTAAVSGLATKLLARHDAGDLAILGSGTQARTHLEAMSAVRKLRRVRVHSKHAENAARFAERESKKYGVKIQVMASAREAIEGADLICTTTSSHNPVLIGEWLAPGAHINAVGAALPTARELDTEAVAKSRLYVDSRESLLQEAGDFIIPKNEGALTDAHITGELGDLVIGKIKGRMTREQITLFKSLGLAIEDLASAQHIYSKAKEKQVGTWLEIGGSSPLALQGEG